MQPIADAHAAAPRVPAQPLGRSHEEVSSVDAPDGQCAQPAKAGCVAKHADCSAMPGRNPPSSTGSLARRVTTGSGDVDDEVMDMVSFTGCEELLRGSHLSVILRGQASILSDRSGSASDYGLSSPTKIIDAFISHNWCVSRWLKWLCLTLHFNLRMAICLTFVIVSPLCALAVSGWVPAYRPAFAPYPRSYVFKLIVAPIFLISLCFCRAIVRCVPTWNPMVFLDKTCIHQEDKLIQRKAIQKLGGFLCHSKTMVICYTDIYISRLWTVYEVASFMALHPVEQLRVIPVMYPLVLIFSLLCMTTAGVIGLVAEVAFGFYYTVLILSFIFFYAIVVVLRHWSKTKVDIYRKVSNFTVRDCTCLYEEDRPLVYANISALMRETQGIGRDASEDAALDCFDDFVRDHLSGALVSSVGAYSMRYEHAAFIGGIFFVPVVMDQLVGLAHGMSLREFGNYALWYAIHIGFVLPCIFILLSTWADLCMRLRGWREYLYLLLGHHLTFVAVVVGRLVFDLLEAWANESNIGLLVFVLLFVVSSAMSCKTMSPSLCPTMCGGTNGHANTASQNLRSQETAIPEKWRKPEASC